jgi:serine/threonine protein kinase
MADDPRVQELLDRLSDSDATPEDVCGSCIELLPVVHARWRQMCRAREDLDALFPPEDGSCAEQPNATCLPLIPGYVVEAELGRGGMGVVYRARHILLNRVVALKMVLAGGPKERERFRREAEAAAALRHPNVVQVHDVGDADGQPYFTMEYVEGGSLAQRLESKPLPIREAAELVRVLSGAVEAAHKTGIVHRDLKPSNVLLTSDGTPDRFLRRIRRFKPSARHSRRTRLRFTVQPSPPAARGSGDTRAADDDAPAWGSPPPASPRRRAPSTGTAPSNDSRPTPGPPDAATP